jgi:hypothetical protein
MYITADTVQYKNSEQYNTQKKSSNTLVSNTREITFWFPDRQRQAERRTQEEVRADIYRERDRERKRKQYLGVVKVSILYGVIGMRNVPVQITVLRDDSVFVMLGGS